MARYSISLALACVLLCLPLRSPAQENDFDKARVTGIVVDAEGRPVAGAEVRSWRRKVKPVHTDAAGRFVIVLDTASVRYAILTAGCDHDARMAYWETLGDSTQVTVEARMVLKPSRAVAVKTVDAAGQPVPHAAVSARQDSTPLVFADCDAEGRAILRIPEDAKITEFAAVKGGAGLDYIENKASAAGLEVNPLPAEVTFTLDGVSHFQIRALDTKDNPVPGVEFCPLVLQKPGKKEELNLSGAHPSFPTIRVTDADGLATFDFLPAQLEGRVTFLCRADDWTTQLPPVWPPKYVADDSLPVISVEMLRCVPASGLVLHADGTPAAGIFMQAQGRGKSVNGWSKYARTGADGTFRFTLAPEQSYLVGVTDKDWAAPSMGGVVMYEGDDRADLLFMLGKGTLLRGTLCNLATGETIAGRTITVIEQGAKIEGKAVKGRWPVFFNEQLARWTTTDSQGRYAMRLGPGRYEIRAGNGDGAPVKILVGDEPEMQRDLHD